MARFLAVVALSAHIAFSQPNIDGGRGDLPGMKQDMFDQVKKNKQNGGRRPSKGPPDCPKSDKMSIFTSMSFGHGEVFVRLNSSEGPCHRLVSIAGANYSVLTNASQTCGPAGEWKKRVAEEMSAVFFQAGLDWVKNENDTLEVIVEVIGEDGVVTEQAFEAEVSEAKYAELMECWKKSCGCEQAANPKMKMVLFALLLCAVGGLGYDSFKLGMESFSGKKPPKHVLSKKGHKMTEVAFAYSHICDICRKTGTSYQCSGGSNYDMCKTCYKAAKKTAKAKLKAWLEKHPEDPDNNKKSKDEDDDDDKKEDSQSEAGDKSTKKESEAESGAGSEAEKSDTPATTGDEKAKSEEEEKEEKDA